MPERKTARRGRPPDPRRRALRRDALLETAARVFARRGYPSAGVDEVAAAMGVGKATVYRHFPSKRALFLAAADRRMAQLRDAVDAAADRAETPLDRIRFGVHAYLAFCDAHPDLVELIIVERAAFRDRRRPTYFQYRDACVGPWIELIRGLQAEGVFRDLPAERISEVIGASLYGTMFTNHFAGRKRPLEEQAGDLLDVLLGGILAGPKGGSAPRKRGRG